MKIRKKNRDGYEQLAPSFAKTTINVIAVLFILHLFLNFIITPLQVQSETMQPLIQAKDRLIYSPLLISEGALNRGDVVVLTPPYLPKNSALKKVRNTVLRFFTLNIVDINRDEKSVLNPYMVRRIIAVPGDTVKLEKFTALVKKQGDVYFSSEFETSQRDYQLSFNEAIASWPQGFPASGNMGERVLGEDEYFVLSDNRGVGNDSRHWGVLPRSRILGKMLFRY